MRCTPGAQKTKLQGMYNTVCTAHATGDAMLVSREPGAGGAVTLQGQAPHTKALIFAFHLLTNQDAPEMRKSKNETPTRKTATTTNRNSKRSRTVDCTVVEV